MLTSDPVEAAGETGYGHILERPNAVVAELGLAAWLTPRQQLELGYSGQFGSESRDHGATARWSVRF